MLFEIFFDPKGKLRETIKGNYFNELFELQKHSSLKDSFDFISEALIASGGKFYALPGRDHELTVTIVTKKEKEAYKIEEIYVDSKNVLCLSDGEFATEIGEPKRYIKRDPEQVIQRLSREFCVPMRLLKITFSPSLAAKAELLVPLGYTVQKTT